MKQTDEFSPGEYSTCRVQTEMQSNRSQIIENDFRKFLIKSLLIIELFIIQINPTKFLSAPIHRN